MTDNVIGLRGAPVEEVKNGGVISLLEQLLAEAKTGKIIAVGLAYVVDETDEVVYKSSWAGPRVTLLGSFSRALYALNKELDGDDRALR